jgi:hypothetical protein
VTLGQDQPWELDGEVMPPTRQLPVVAQPGGLRASLLDVFLHDLCDRGGGITGHRAVLLRRDLGYG